ncbi:MAG: metal-dependent hydrolase [Nitrospinota bacterium]
MTPIGHAAVSVLAGQASRRLPLWALVLGGVLPDADYAFFPFDFFMSIHRVVTHNLAFAFGAALLAAGVARREKGWAALAAFAGVVLHCLADSVMDSNAANGIGVALFWPFSGWMFSPFNLAPEVGRLERLPDLWTMLQRSAWALKWEAPVWLLAGWLWFRRWKVPVSREGETHARGMV